MKPPSSRALLALVLLVLLASGASQWLHARGEERIAVQLAALAGPGDIQLISSDTCIYCAHARTWMNTYRIAHSECFIEQASDCMAAYMAAGARGTPTVVVRGQPQTGFEPQQVLKALRG